jgi:hypothetical protein
MLSAGELRLEEGELGRYIQVIPVPLRKPDTSMFTAAELDLVNYLIDEFYGLNATQISEESHKFLGWRLVGEGEIIPYEFALLDRCDPSEAEREHARAIEPLAREHLAMLAGEASYEPEG